MSSKERLLVYLGYEISLLVFAILIALEVGKHGQDTSSYLGWLRMKLSGHEVVLFSADRHIAVLMSDAFFSEEARPRIIDNVMSSFTPQQVSSPSGQYNATVQAVRSRHGQYPVVKVNDVGKIFQGEIDSQIMSVFWSTDSRFLFIQTVKETTAKLLMFDLESKIAAHLETSYTQMPIVMFDESNFFADMNLLLDSENSSG